MEVERKICVGVIWILIGFFCGIVYSQVDFLAPDVTRSVTASDKDSAVIMAGAEQIFQLKERVEREDKIKDKVEELWKQLATAQKIYPYWNTLEFPSKDVFRIVVNIVDKEKRPNVVLMEVERRKDEYGKYIYNVKIEGDKQEIYPYYIGHEIGIDFTPLLAILSSSQVTLMEKVGLPPAVKRWKELRGINPKRGPLGYLYLVSEEEQTRLPAVVVEKLSKRLGKPIKAVVVIGIGGQSLANRTVYELLGEKEKVVFIFPENITNLGEWISAIENIPPGNIVLYVNSKSGTTDETMANFQMFFPYLIRRINPEIGKRVANKFMAVRNVVEKPVTQIATFSPEEQELLERVLKQVVVATKEGTPLYQFAKNNNIPIMPIPENVAERFTALFPSTYFTNQIAGVNIEEMREAVIPLVPVLENNSPEVNPALQMAMLIYAVNPQMIVPVAEEPRLTVFFEWLRQLVNESLGKENKGPYLNPVIGEELYSYFKQPEGKVFVVFNTPEYKVKLPEGVPAIVINLGKLNEERLANLFLFFEEFVVRYATLIGVNPINQPWVERFKGILTETVEKFSATLEARMRRQEEVKKMVTIQMDIFPVPKKLKDMLEGLTKEDRELEELPRYEPKPLQFKSVMVKARNRLPKDLEFVARKLALNMYQATMLGKEINPFFIYSAKPEMRNVGKFIKYVSAHRFEELSGGIIWDVLYGTTDQHSTAQYLGGGTPTTFTTFIKFLQEEENPLILRANGLVQERLNGLTPNEVRNLYLESVSQALWEEGRFNNKIIVPGEEEEYRTQLYYIIARASELYSRLYNMLPPSKIGEFDFSTPSVVFTSEGTIFAGEYGREKEIPSPEGIEVATLLKINGIGEKRFITPPVKAQEFFNSLIAHTRKGFNAFVERMRMVMKAGNLLFNPLRSSVWQIIQKISEEKPQKVEVYAIKLEDIIAKIEFGEEIGETMWQELRIKQVNTLVARTVQALKRTNSKARVIVYTEDRRITDENFKFILNAVDCGGIFDGMIIGNAESVLHYVVTQRWVNNMEEAKSRTVFATAKVNEGVKNVVVPEEEKFVPFPEVGVAMKVLLNTEEGVERLDIDRILDGYKIWLELSGFNSEEIKSYLANIQDQLVGSTPFLVKLPIPPVPKPGSVVDLLDKEYKSLTEIKAYA